MDALKCMCGVNSAKIKSFKFFGGGVDCTDTYVGILFSVFYGAHKERE